VAAVTVVSASAGTFTLTMLKAGSFTLTAGRAADSNWNAATNVTSALVTVAKALPAWSTGAGAPAATALVYGQRLTASTLSGTAFGVGGATDIIAGDLTFASSVNVNSFPGSTDVSGLVSPKTYAVTFTPTGADAERYAEISSTVDVALSPAVPYMLSGVRAQGSGIFSSTQVATASLADSTLSGTVFYTFDGAAAALSGSWAWDADEDGVQDSTTYLQTVQYTTEGLKEVAALFVPNDARIGSYVANGTGTPLRPKAQVPVYSPRTNIDVAPTIADMPYGAAFSISDVDTSAARVVAIAAGTNAETVIYDESAGIRLGTWSLKAGTSVAVNSTTGTQDVLLVFTPDDTVDWSNVTAGGYAVAEVTVSLTVTPVDPMSSLDPLARPVILKYGDALSASSSLLASGLSFSAPGNFDVAGSLEWVEPALVPGSGSATTDEAGNDPKDGTWLAWVRFTPDAVYGSAYGQVLVRLEIAVVANDPTLGAVADGIVDIEDALNTIAGIGSGATGIDGRENYHSDAMDFAGAASVAASAELAAGANGPTGAITQAKAESLEALLASALAGLTHSHPILANSAGSSPIVDYDTGLTVEVAGAFATVSAVSLDSVPFELDFVPATVGTAGSTSARIDLYANGSGGAASGAPVIGSVTEGSAVVRLFAPYVDTLSQGGHSLEVQFTDSFTSGSGTAPFAVMRADTPGTDPDNNGGGGSGSSGGATPQTGDTLLPWMLVFTLLDVGLLCLFIWWDTRRRQRRQLR
jgi:hypothetical protein